jgi:hypothetical protein
MFQHGSACYSTAQQANQAQASEVIGSIVQIGSVPHAVSVAGVTDSSIAYVLENLTGPGTYAKTVQVVPQPCNLLQATDALTLGWAVAAAWIGAFCVVFIARIFRDAVNTQNDHGNS